MVLTGLLFYGYNFYQIYETKQNLYTDNNNITYAARIANNTYQTFSDGEWQDFIVKGVNIGVAEPGSFPGDMSIDKATYLRWFKHISEMNANTIRVYTLQNTDFYEALFEFNLNNNKPLYLIHGVWVNEDAIFKYQDAFNPAVYDVYKEAFNIINVIHGNAIIEPKPGCASGKYTKDVSHYVIGWILGIEFEADLVNQTNMINPEKTSFQGKFLYTTDNANPFEVFLAEIGDKVISYETEKYGMQRPTAFSNWLTTDPLDHPNEPTPEVEDSATIDVEHIKWENNFAPGMFASYHVYPYYPDFLNHDTKYISTDGNVNTYKAYLEELTNYHSLPVLVAEVGLPSNRGLAHRSIYSGYNQGHLNEKQQGEYISNLIDDILETGCLGFLVFSWQDEWFKPTWNTADLEDPDGRPFWHNVQSCENNFGLLSFDAGEVDSNLYVDGNYDEWTKDDVLLTTNGYTLSVKENSTYLYLLVETKDFDFESDTIYIPIDTIQGQGNSMYLDYNFNKDCDFIIRIEGENNSEVLVDSYYDVFYYKYAVLNNLYNYQDYYNTKNSNNFSSILLAINYPHYLPETDEYTEFEVVNTGKLKYGINNPNSEFYDCLADFYYHEGKIEIRIPWGLLLFSNPARCEIIDDLYANQEISFTTIDSIAWGLGFNKNKNVELEKYQLKGWTKLIYHERFKETYYILQQKYATINSKEFI